MAVPRFGELEAAVMECMWSYGRPVSVRVVLEALQQDRTIAYTTAMTVMDNLYKKGWLRRRKVGRAFEYEPVATKAGYTARLMREVLAASDNQAAALVHFLTELSPAEAQALRAALKIVPQEEDA